MPPRRNAAWRRILGQVHLWTGVALAIYVIVLCLSGSLIVLRPQFHRWVSEPDAPVLRAVEWMVDLHDNLLADRTGRKVNGVGGMLLTVLLVTGLVVWWPGRSRWKRALTCGSPARTKAFARRLHVSAGFWISGLLLVWATTAIYFGFPGMFDGLPETLVDSLVRLHFGRFGGYVGRVAWIILGLVPMALAVTGLILWWPRRGTPAGRDRQLKARAALAGLPLSDYLIREVRKIAEQPTPDEMRRRLQERERRRRTL